VTQLWEAFCRERAPAWRTNTTRLNNEDWAHFSNFVGPHTLAEGVGRETIAAFREEMERREYAVSTIRRCISTARQVWGFAQDADLILKSRIGNYRYRVHKDKQTEPPDEYRMEEFGALLEAIPIDRRGGWRAHVALGICGYQGNRSWAVLHLQWADCDFEAGLIHWRPDWQKSGKPLTQPMREPTRALLLVARAWHKTLELDTPWVFPPGSLKRAKVHTETFTPQSLWAALRRAERRAGIEHRERRASHGSGASWPAR
jgi:integrase